MSRNLDAAQTLLERKAEIARRRHDEPTVELYRKLSRHLKAIVYIIAELHLGYKPDL